jgi:tetratricopeptide (TPR) repeat protein
MANHNAIFISYRRSDIPVEQVNLIHEALENEFGRNTVFLDTADIHSGEKWKKILTDEGANAKVCLVLIGPNWLVKDTSGVNRILQEGDWVRQEIEFAIKKNLRIIPLLVNGGKRPSPDDLPDSLKSFNDSQVLKLNTAEWSIYKVNLINELKRYVPLKPKKSLNWLFILLPVLLASAYGINAWMRPHNPSGNIGITAKAIDPCLPFDVTKKLKTLVFPVFSTDHALADASLLIINNTFDSKCNQYKVSHQNQLAQVPRDSLLLNDSKLNWARQCGADLYFTGVLAKDEDKPRFIADFNLTVDTLAAYIASPNDFKINLAQFHIADLIDNNKVDAWYDKVIQCIIGIHAYQTKDFNTTIEAMKDIIGDSSGNKPVEKVALRLLADSYYQLKQSDSCLKYQQRLSELAPVHSNVLKTALLAEQYKKPVVAIDAYSKLIDSSNLNKSKLYERRADQYDAIKEYPKAKEDYQKVIPSNPEQKKRVENRTREIDTKILNNQNEISKADLHHLQATDAMKLDLADKFLQNGDALKATAILNTISKSSEVYKAAEPIRLEAQIKTNPAASIQVTEAAKIANPRLEAAVKMKKNMIISH